MTACPAARPADEKPEEAKKRRGRSRTRSARRLFAGKVDAGQGEGEGQGRGRRPAEPQGPWKEETKGQRWVVITGVIDNEQLKKNWLLALKNPAIAYPNYKRLDVERQTRQSDGTWTDWAADRPGQEPRGPRQPPRDSTPRTSPRPSGPRPWSTPCRSSRPATGPGSTSPGSSPPRSCEVAQGRRRPAPGGMPMPGMAARQAMPGGDARRSGRVPAWRRRMPGGMGMGAGPGWACGMGMGVARRRGRRSAAEEPNFTKIEDPTLMIRSLDFTVEPDTTYRFRVRIVVVNPNKDHTDVNPGVDTESKELLGPWSEPTDEVTSRPTSPPTPRPPSRPTAATTRSPSRSSGGTRRRPDRRQERRRRPRRDGRRVRLGPDALLRGGRRQAGQHRLQQPGHRPRHHRRPRAAPRHRRRAEPVRGPGRGDGRRARRLGRRSGPGPRQGRRGPQGHGDQLPAGHRGLGQEARARRRLADARHAGDGPGSRRRRRR